MTPSPTDLEKIITEHIEANGSMSLGAFTTLALTHPDHGYYTCYDPLGAEGDFTTAPEISQIFGELIGAWVVDTWMQMGKPAFNLIECGPGRGTLMADIMRVGKMIPEFLNCAHVQLIETQGMLRKKQAKALAQYDAAWHVYLSDIQTDKPCIILGNEFLDALPIEQLRRDDKGWQKRVLSVDPSDKSLCFDWAAAEDDLRALRPSKTESHQPYEVSPARIGFIDGCAKMLDGAGGAALFIDYGYQKSHYGDTLQAMRHHSFSDVLADIGQSDITSHVDFDALTRAIEPQQAQISPVTTQRMFLLHLGIEQRAEALIQANPSRQEDIRKDVDRLIGRDQMGDLFKVMCFYKGNIKPCGFE